MDGQQDQMDVAGDLAQFDKLIKRRILALKSMIGRAMPIDEPRWETTPPDAQALLTPFRQKIDALDARIVALLGERFAVVRQVAALKAEHGIHPVLTDRVEEVVEHVRSTALREGFDPAIAEQLYRLLVHASCRLEADLIGSDAAAKR